MNFLSKNIYSRGTRIGFCSPIYLHGNILNLFEKYNTYIARSFVMILSDDPHIVNNHLNKGDKLEIEIVTVQGIEVAPQASSGQNHHHHHNHHERSHSRPQQGPSGARQRPKVFFIVKISE